MAEVDNFDAIRISLASPDQIKSWSYGEVTKPETINYRTLKPEKDGLFCERIFGPTKDYECYCGKYKKQRYRGVICDKCGVRVEPSKVRRVRMGHIELAAPVAHPWFAKGIPSRLALLLNLSPRSLEHVLYFAQYVVTSVSKEASQEKIGQLKEEYSQWVTDEGEVIENQLKEAAVQATDPPEQEEQVRHKYLEERSQKEEDLHREIDDIEDLRPLKLLSETRYQELRDEYGDIFNASMGAEAVLQILKGIDLEELHLQLVEEVRSTSGQRRKKASKRLRVVESFRRSGNKPEWMILTVLPVLPPELRPIVQLDGGRFATSDLNDLYRRVINRNNRLRRLIELGAPDIIVRNEKRMLQEAVDSLIDNGRRGRALTTSGNRKLKSLSDMLRGKQGRFRQNLLGKRVDYSGRSVIVVGPELKLYQCGLPKRMALELFKPFVIRRLVQEGFAHNIKSARRQIERAKPEVWDLLEEVVKERPVFLNRAPTLHRLGIQAFEPVLIDGNAIQIHPLVCAAFNADFDGDQMAVHLPLSKAAIREAREQMLSIHNMLLPSSGEPVVAPTLDMVLGCYYLTSLKPSEPGSVKRFGSFEEAKLAYDHKIIELGEQIEVRQNTNGADRITTTVGRILFNEVLPPEIPFQNKLADKGSIKRLIGDCYRLLGDKVTAKVLDDLKQLGFIYATKSGTTIALKDIEVPAGKGKVLEEADEKIAVIDNQFNRGLITEDERYAAAVQVWNEATERITDILQQSLDRYGSIYMMATSGAKGNISQIRQMAGMRGLMTDPSGKIIDFPIKSSFREGLTVMEYFISTHGARKGLADTALRTSDSGYLTRRLIDVAQDVIVLEEDCEIQEGIWISEEANRELLPPLGDRIVGRMAAADVVDQKTGEVIVASNQEIDEEKIALINKAGITRVFVRSPLVCHARRGICQKCYGRDLARRELARIGTAVGVIAAQSIGEPGTQLTMRTFHTGGVVGLDITSGLPRVEELFEARTPKGQAILSEIDGVAEIVETEEERKVRIVSSESYLDEYVVPRGAELLVSNGQWLDIGSPLTITQAPKGKKSQLATSKDQPLLARVSGHVVIEDSRLYVRYEERDEREYPLPPAARIRIKQGARVKAGEQITDGIKDPQAILHILGREAVQQYLVEEIQKVYRSQGVNINDKHIETIIGRMLSRVRVESSGDTELLPGELVDRFDYENTNAKVLSEGGEPATAQTVLLGITRASLNTNSWLAAASFQETTRVLTEAALWGKIDKLNGLKENVIIGRLIPASATIQLAPPEIEADVEALLPPVEGAQEEQILPDEGSTLPS